MLQYHWLFELIVIIYALSVLFYFIDFLQRNRRANQVAFWLLFMVWILQTLYFVSSAIHHQAIPIYSQMDTLFFYAWLLISISLFIHWFFRLDFILLFVNIIGFVVLAFSLFVEGKEIPEEIFMQLSSGWLIIHISMAFISYAAFTISFIFSLVYLIQHRSLKKKKWIKQFKRWPSLAQLDSYAFRLNIVSIPLLLISLIMGMVWAYFTLDDLVWLDTKVIFSLFVLIMYFIYMYQRIGRGWLGIKINELNVICFIVLITNYVLSNLFSQFHLW